MKRKSLHTRLFWSARLLGSSELVMVINVNFEPFALLRVFVKYLKQYDDFKNLRI